MHLGHMEAARQIRKGPSHRRYAVPDSVRSIPLADLLVDVNRAALADKQLDFLRSKNEGTATIYYAGNLDVLRRPAVSIVGTRDVSDAGWSRASRLARELVAANVTIVSGLAKGVDTAAMTSAVECGGSVVGVIGTPIDKAYPAENTGLQEELWREHLLLTPFRVGEQTFRGNFPKRNRVMAAISDATVIVEASDTSGTLHQAAECGRLGRWLFIMRSVAEDHTLSWPGKFLDKPKVAVISSTEEVVNALSK